MDIFEDILSSLLMRDHKPRNPWLASLPTDTRLWLAKITREAKEREKANNVG